MIEVISKNKVNVSQVGIALFNAQWPGSELRSTRSYWFEFDDDQDLIDTDCPLQDDGPASLALSQDCQAYLFDDLTPDWVV